MPHGFVAELVGMVHRLHASLYRVQRSGLAGGVNGDRAGARSFGHRSCELRLGVLVRRLQRAIDDLVRAGLVDLGEVGPLLQLLAHDFDDLLGVVGAVGVRQHVLLGIEAVRVFVSTENVDGIPADAKPRPRNQALIDRVTHCGVG